MTNDPKDKFRTLDDAPWAWQPPPMPRAPCWMLRTVADERPNAWRRFWAWALLGRRWERIE